MPPIIKTATAYDRIKEERITPIPGAVWRDRRWSVKGTPTGGRTDIHGARMEADYTASAAGDYTRAHEMVHTVISPEIPPSENKDAYVILEEAQVHQYMRMNLDLPREAYKDHENQKQQVFERAMTEADKMTRRQRAFMAVAVGDQGSGNAHDVKRVRELLGQKDGDQLLQLIDHTIRYTPNRYDEHEHRRQQELAARFDLLFTEEEDDSEDEQDEGEGESTSKGKSKGKSEDEDGDEDEGDDEKDETHESKSKEKAPIPKEKQKEDYKRHDEEEAQWGPMEFEKPALIHASKALRLLQKRKQQDTGSHITRITRIVSDGFVFGEKKRVQGGTVVVDTSGSMAIKPADLQELLDKAPAATVAIYAQADGPRPNPVTGRYEEYGILRVVVDKGRMAATEQLHIGSGNLVDGPALDWLAKQPEPRFWVSDGYVIGSNGSGKAHLNYCARVCKKNRIVRLADIPTAIERFTGKKQVVVKR